MKPVVMQKMVIVGKTCLFGPTHYFHGIKKRYCDAHKIS